MKSEVAIVQCTCKKFVFCGGGYDKSLQIGQEPFLEAATTKKSQHRKAQSTIKCTPKVEK